ncbi:MAG: glycosyltransferase family 4 protein [Synechococcaceae cyanobacterium]|nr:glycosyltransferase family 4 protein [Synechococcaceae cyanobacterium]
MPPAAFVILPVLAAAGLTWLLLAALVPRLRRGLLDHPNARSSHQRPTPRGGGVAFVIVGSALTAVLGEGRVALVPLLCCPLALVGLLDDRFDLPAGIRYGAQLLTAAALLALAITPLPWWSVPLVWIAITAVINFFNFMDGLDGLVAGCGIVLLGLLASLPGGAGLAPLAGSLLGFLAWNWNPARVFMGDVGSTWLGAVFAGLVLQQPTPGASAALLLVALPLLADPLICVLRRLADGQPVFQAHRLHLYQRLHQAGWSHPQVASLLIAGSAALALALRWGSLPLLLSLAAGELAIGVALDRRVALSFNEASDSSRRSKP